MASGQDICSSCGKYTDITAKVIDREEVSYCKECQDKELKKVLENFNRISFYCINCGSSKVTKKDPKTGVNITDIPNIIYVSTFVMCDDCNHSFYVNMEDQGRMK